MNIINAITFIIVMISKQEDRKVIWIARKALQRESLINSVSDSGKIVLNLKNKNGKLWKTTPIASCKFNVIIKLHFFRNIYTTASNIAVIIPKPDNKG